MRLRRLIEYMKNDNHGLPIATRLSCNGTSSSRKVIFKCPRCNISFRFYEEQEKFCHNCGLEIDWDSVKCNLVEGENAIKKYFEDFAYASELIKTVNEKNQEFYEKKNLE